MKPKPSLLQVAFLASAGWLVPCGTTIAQVDRVYLIEGSPIGGSIESINKGGVAIKVGSNTENVASGDIEKIMFQGDPAPLTRGREFALDGQYDQAVEELRQIDVSSLSREASKADAAYYLILSQAKLALAGRGDKTAAAGAAVGFNRTYPDSWHYYSIQKLTGDLALALSKYDQAISFYETLRSSPSVSTKIGSVYFSGIAQLAKGEAQAAEELFDKVIGLQVQTPSARRLQSLAKAGKAVALADADKADEGLKLVNTLIEDMVQTDVEMGARIYNAQGACYESKGDTEGAVLAYLHTHLMFSSQPDAHAQSLARLVELWPILGKPERAAEAKQELQERYPGYGT